MSVRTNLNIGNRSSHAPLSVKRNVVPDQIDLRDRPYMPPVGVIPESSLFPKSEIPVLNQQSTNACTGFSLASIVFHLQKQAKRDPSEWRVSPFMLYSMARRYDEFPGDPSSDTGSSLRGAMKGWFKHGACADRLWETEKMPIAQFGDPANDWWLDAAKRPLGAYYRVDTNSETDMHVALNEVGILFASAVCHLGWNKGFSIKPKQTEKYWRIPHEKADMSDGGHAFAIVGYTPEGFIILNSWGEDWGTDGKALLSYDDWNENAMDCWVAQLGVVTEARLSVACRSTLRIQENKVRLANESSLRRREMDPFIIDMENNGKLSNTGEFRTQVSDVHALVNQQLGAAREAWKLKDPDPVDIAIYAHGGLVSEKDAVETAEKWIPALYENKIFPIFLMWETDLFSTMKNRFEDVLADQPRPTAGVFDSLKRWWNERLEKLLSKPGTMIWDEIKQNASEISSNPQGGGKILYDACNSSPHFSSANKVRLHLIGHSAGAILHTHIIKRLGDLGWKFETVNFMAPAVRVDVFREKVLPAIQSKNIQRYNQFHLTDLMEQKDPTCKPILGYGRSLLYLVSQSFEKGQITPILGMEKYIGTSKLIELDKVKFFTAPGSETQSTTHGDFDNDDLTMHSIISQIKSSGKK